MRAILLIFFIFILYFNIGCGGIKEPANQRIEIIEPSFTSSKDTFKFNICPNENDCTKMFDCHHNYYLSDQLFDYETIIRSRKYFKFEDLLACTVVIYNTDTARSELADKCLYEYHYKAYLKSVKDNRSPIPTGDLSKLSFHKWNSIKSFEICILYMSKNGHDSMGHGDCTNLSVRFFEEIILPKIKSIDGMDFWTYYDKNTKDVNYGPLDCFDSFYEAVYPLLKQAWEDGKIELKDVQINE